jgi:hypothetical protein
MLPFFQNFGILKLLSAQVCSGFIYLATARNKIPSQGQSIQLASETVGKSEFCAGRVGKRKSVKSDV